MTSRRGPRRSRVYEGNFNIAESYYKSAIDRLDKKNSPAEPETIKIQAALPKPVFDFNGDVYDEELQTARNRASKAIGETTLLDTRGGKFGVNAALESEFDDQIQASLNRIRASKKLLSSFDTEEAIDTIKRQSKAELNEKISEIANSESLASSAASSRRALKISSVAENVSDSKSLMKWKNETSESFATKRADATKARLHDIESEMQEFEDKQAARARRSAHVKQLLAETQSNTADNSVSSSNVSTIKTIRTVKKVVSF